MRHVNATTTSTHDAVNLRHDFATPLDITNGEWNTGGMTNHPACYTTNRLATIRARFTVTPASVTNLTIGATVSGATPILADLVATNILFSGGVSVGDADGYVTLAFATPTPSVIRKSADTWQWHDTAANTTTFAAAPITTTGPHTNFTIFAESNLPWSNTFGTPTNTWVIVLDIVCSDTWAGGAKTIEDAASQITRAIYESGRFQYDSLRGRSFYTRFARSGTIDYFDLTSWIARLNGKPGRDATVNCWDCANGVVSLANVLGCDLWNQWIGESFECNAISAIKDQPWDKPFGWGFSYHRIGWRGAEDATGRVFDACLKVTGDIVPADMVFGTNATPGGYKFLLVAPASYGKCSPNAVPANPTQTPRQRRDPIR